MPKRYRRERIFVKTEEPEQHLDPIVIDARDWLAHGWHFECGGREYFFIGALDEQDEAEEGTA